MSAPPSPSQRRNRNRPRGRAPSRRDPSSHSRQRLAFVIPPSFGGPADLTRAVVTRSTERPDLVAGVRAGVGATSSLTPLEWPARVDLDLLTGGSPAGRFAPGGGL